MAFYPKSSRLWDKMFYHPQAIKFDCMNNISKEHNNSIIFVAALYINIQITHDKMFATKAISAWSPMLARSPP